MYAFGVPFGGPEIEVLLFSTWGRSFLRDFHFLVNDLQGVHGVPAPCAQVNRAKHLQHLLRPLTVLRVQGRRFYLTWAQKTFCRIVSLK